MEIDQNQIPQDTRGCGNLFKACAIITILLIAVVIGLSIYAIRLPIVRDLMQCRENMETVGAAIDRYHGVTGSYPDELEQLKDEYLKDPSVLSCPVGEGGEECYFTYNKPKETSPEDFVVLECDAHVLGEKGQVRLMYLKGGDIEVEAIEPKQETPTDSSESKQ